MQGALDFGFLYRMGRQDEHYSHFTERETLSLSAAQGETPQERWSQQPSSPVTI